MTANRRPGLLVLSLVVLISIAAWAGHRGDASAAPPAARAAAMTPALQSRPATAGTLPADGSVNAERNARIRDLDTQIKSLRDSYHQQLDPLEAQIKGLHEKFDPQIQSLVDQRKDVVESGKPDNIRALDEQESSELAALADKEKADVDKVRADYGAQRKAIQQKYDDQRKALRGGK
jgi:hypothetical protein